MRILITGGSGYIGSHIARQLAERGDDPVIVDDLVTGQPDRVAGLPLHRLDLAHPDAPGKLATILRDEGVSAVIHLAARKQAGESVERPLWYHQQNGAGLAAVLSASVAAGVRDVVFSSSAAVYGDASGEVTETSLVAPVNPYGQTKLTGEWLTAATARAEGLRAVSLRYFNVAGAQWADLADTARLNLVPMVLDRVRSGQPAQIFGDDYATIDGTCVRDFVHVADVADAHLAVLDALPTQSTPHRVYNVGTGVGSTVRQVVDGIRSRLPGSPDPVVLPRRPGDPAAVVADVSLIELELGWRAQYGLDEILDSACVGA